ncbi:hypothetical protein ABT158_30760 [Nonomuraea sp. NPDC001636]|uniref:hypothetical protein n=1 Tax=Nonomuraea sp. NPDC001636 TaxID=3154391 RepID=UPI00331BFF99
MLGFLPQRSLRLYRLKRYEFNLELQGNSPWMASKSAAPTLTACVHLPTKLVDVANAGPVADPPNAAGRAGVSRPEPPGGLCTSGRRRSGRRAACFGQVLQC